MITINLLPERFRASNRMPVGKFIGVLAAVLVAFSAAGYYFNFQFGSLAQTRSEREQAETEVAGLKAQAQYHADLTAEMADYEKRESKIREIGASRVLWTKKLDELADIVNAGEDAGRYTVWFQDLSADQNADTKGTHGGKFTANGLSGSANYANVADFHSDLQRTQFFKDFISINNPGGKQTDLDPKLIPSQAFEFKLDMALKPPPESLIKKSTKKAPAKPGAKPGAKPDATKKGG